MARRSLLRSRMRSSSARGQPQQRQQLEPQQQPLAQQQQGWRPSTAAALQRWLPATAAAAAAASEVSHSHSHRSSHTGGDHSSSDSSVHSKHQGCSGCMPVCVCGGPAVCAAQLSCVQVRHLSVCQGPCTAHSAFGPVGNHKYHTAAVVGGRGLEGGRACEAGRIKAYGTWFACTSAPAAVSSSCTSPALPAVVQISWLAADCS